MTSSDRAPRPSIAGSPPSIAGSPPSIGGLTVRHPLRLDDPILELLRAQNVAILSTLTPVERSAPAPCGSTPTASTSS